VNLDATIDTGTHSPRDAASGVPQADTYREVESWLGDHLQVIALLVTAAGFMVRLVAAGRSYLNPDEALQYAKFNQASVRLAYEAGQSLAHPPLYYFLLYFWHLLGRSELMLRLPSVFLGTALCWLSFKWITRLFGRTAGLIGLMLVTFCPALIALSAEVRQYALLLFCMFSALYFLDQAFQRNSLTQMWYYSIFVYLAILSHYSAFFFVVAVGFYSLTRLAEPQFPRKLAYHWLVGQIGAVAIYVFLYLTHLSRLRTNLTGWGADLDKFYFHSYRDDIFVFTRHQTLEIFRYLFAQSYVAEFMLLLFIAGIAVLFIRDLAPRSRKTSSRLGILFSFPLVALWLAALAGFYPFVPTRHTVFLAPFVIAASSFLLATLCRQKLSAGLLTAMILMGVANLYGYPTETLSARENQRRAHMTAAVDYVQRSIPKGDLIFVDYQSSLPLVYYLCGPKQIISLDNPRQGFLQFSCNDYFVVSVPFWKLRAESLALPFQKMVHTYGLKPGDRVWVFQAGWMGNLVAQLQELPQFHCLAPRAFGENISVVPFVVGSDLMPAAPPADCKP
jgi:uncharacterized membrane protein